MIKLCTLSDLHIGDGTKSDDFTLDDDKVIKFLKQCIKDYDRVILNGDVFECWQSQSWDAQQNQLSRIFKAHPQLCAFIYSSILSKKMIYVSGNHDSVCRTKSLIPNVVKRYIETIPVGDGFSIKVLFEHGHAADIANDKLSWFGKFIAWGIGWLERKGWKDADEDLGRMEKYIPGYRSDKNVFFKYANSLLKKGYDVVVFGHTHKQCVTTIIDTKPSKYYVNTGASMSSPFTFTEIIINPATCTISIHQNDQVLI
mgnify:FL=1